MNGKCTKVSFGRARRGFVLVNGKLVRQRDLEQHLKSMDLAEHIEISYEYPWSWRSERVRLVNA